MPLGMEISLEETYPLDPATGASFIYVYGQLAGVLCIILSGVLKKPLTDPGDLEIEVYKRQTMWINF